MRIKKKTLQFGFFMGVVFILLMGIDITNRIGTNPIKLFVLFVLLGMHLLNRKRFSATTIWVEMAYLVIFASTMINGRSLRNAFSALLAPVAMMLFFDYGMKTNRDIFMKVVKGILLLFVSLNFITLLFFPNGLYTVDGSSLYWFLGFKNIHVRYIIPAVAIVMAEGLRKKEKIGSSTILLFSIGLLSCVLAKSSTGIMGMVVFGSLLLADRMRGRVKAKIWKVILNPAVIIVVILLLDYVILLGEASFLAGFIKEYFGKDMTFTGRAYVWERCIELIQAQPFLGYGYINSTDFFYMIAVNIGAHPHNYILGWVFYGGVLSLLMIFLAYVVVTKKCIKSATSESRIYMWAFISFLVMGITDVGLFSVLFHPMLLMCEESVQKKKELKT